MTSNRVTTYSYIIKTSSELEANLLNAGQIIGSGCYEMSDGFTLLFGFSQANNLKIQKVNANWTEYSLKTVYLQDSEGGIYDSVQ